MKYGVGVVLSGHEHVYERVKPQHGISYFVPGNSGRLRYHNLRPSAEMTKGFDTDCPFMLVEIAGDQFYFETISREGRMVDSGVLEKVQRTSARLFSPFFETHIVPIPVTQNNRDTISSAAGRPG